jgi:hypothetical protein
VTERVHLPRLCVIGERGKLDVATRKGFSPEDRAGGVSPFMKALFLNGFRDLILSGSLDESPGVCGCSG